MAKISARGDRESKRWRREEDGAELVLTVKGRLLWKPMRGGSFTLLQAKAGVGFAEAHVAERGMEPV